MATNSKPKIDLDSVEPATFPWTVKIPTPRGEIDVEFQFIARTRAEMAAHHAAIIERAQQEWSAAKQAAEPVTEDMPFAKPAEVIESAKRQTASDVEAILQIAKGWNLPHEFNAENLTKLCDRYHAAGGAIGAAYREAHARGRLGN